MPASRQTDYVANHIMTGAEPALPAAGTPPVVKRLSRRQLISLNQHLGKKDIDILKIIRKYRFVTSGQIKRLCFVSGSTDTANLRAANRALKKLREYGLIAPLTRRIGGVRAGSSSLIWHLTEPGERLLQLDDPEQHRKRFEEPSSTFLTHTLAVTEFAVQLYDMARSTDNCKIIKSDPEPYCWRTFRSRGETVYLKPDLFIILRGRRYEDYYYCEIDLGTESMAKLIKKCQIYYDHYRSGEDHERIGVAPLIAWIVPDEARKNMLMEKITEQFPDEADLFRVYSAADNAPWRIYDVLE